MPRKELLELMHRQRFKVQLGRYLKVWIVIKMCKETLKIEYAFKLNFKLCFGMYTKLFSSYALR